MDGNAIAAARARAARFGRWHPAEAVAWVAAVAAYFVFPGYMALGAQALILVLFALSLDLILGYAGIVSLGHAAYFGIGAYAAGMLSAHLGWHEPLSGLLFAGVVAAAYGFVTGVLLLRYHGLTLLMLTLVAAILLHETANAWSDVTGGFDGLLGITPAPIFGIFEYDLWGRTNYGYVLAVLFACFLVARRLVYSPFGRALVGLRENSRRMHALGAPVYWRQVQIYVISCAMAGIAGGLFAQTNAFVTMDALSFLRSGIVIIVLILGGIGRLYGAFLGGVIYAVLEDQLAKASPEFWEFGVGLVLICLVLFARDGIAGLAEQTWRRLRP